MYEKAGYCGALIFLGYLAVYDIKWRKIPAAVVCWFGILSILYFITGKPAAPGQLIFRILPGMLLLLLALLTGEKIGYGDGAAVLVLGFWTGGIFCAGIVCLGTMMTGVYSLYRMMQKSREPIPLIPFLLAAMEVILLYA